MKTSFITNLHSNQDDGFKRVYFPDEDFKTVKKDHLMKLHEFLEAVLYDKTEGKGKILTEELLQGKAKNTTEEYNLTFPPELNFSCKLPLHLKRYNGIV